MKTSKFRFSTPELLKINYEVNRSCDDLDEGEDVNVKTNISKRHQILGETSAVVQLKIEIGSLADNACPFYIEVTYQSDFTWEKDAFDDDTLEKLLSKNATLLLLSYARPLIAQITNASGFPAFNLPYFDLT